MTDGADKLEAAETTQSDEQVSYTQSQSWPIARIGIVLCLVAAAIWAMAVTKEVFFTETKDDQFRSVQLQPLVQEYIQAQARSGNSEESAAAQTAMFMAALDRKLTALGSQGYTVVISEAIVSNNVPDITDELRTAVLAEVPLPAQAAVDIGNGQPSLVQPVELAASSEEQVGYNEN